MTVLYMYTFLQIIFEALPVSSSGNLLVWIPLLQNLFDLTFYQSSPPDFDFLLYIPTFFVLTAFFFKEWVVYLWSFSLHKRRLYHLGFSCALADLCTAIFYFFLKDRVGASFPLALGFLCTTALLFSLRWHKNGNQKPQDLSLKDGVILGIIQGVAVLPGISRLASTFVGGVWLGYSYHQSLRYSFLIHIPLMVCAIVKACIGVFQYPADFFLLDRYFYMVLLMASVIAFCFLHFLSAMVERRSVWKFGWYTGLLSLLAAYVSW